MLTEEEIFEYLLRFYKKLKTNVLSNNKKSSGSVLLDLLNMKSNSRYSFLDKSSKKDTLSPKDFISYLVKNNYLRPTDSVGKYTLTAKGILEVEQRIDKLDIYKITDFMDKKYFNLFDKTKELTDKEKITLLMMIAIRSFSKDSAINLKKGELTLNKLKQLIIDSFTLLLKHKRIKK